MPSGHLEMHVDVLVLLRLTSPLREQAEDRTVLQEHAILPQSPRPRKLQKLLHALLVAVLHEAAIPLRAVDVDGPTHLPHLLVEADGPWRAQCLRLLLGQIALGRASQVAMLLVASIRQLPRLESPGLRRLATQQRLFEVVDSTTQF